MILKINYDIFASKFSCELNVHFLMKQISCHFILLFLSINFLFGQKSKLSIGLEGGGAVVTLFGHDNLKPSESLHIGHSLGVSIEYKISDKVSLKSNILHEKKGNRIGIIATDEQGNPLGEFNVYTEFEYVTLPLLTRVTFGNDFRFYLNGGPYLGYLIRHKEIQEEFTIFPRIEGDRTGHFKRIDLGLTLGMGISYQLIEELSLGFDVRSNIGLLNISKLPVFNNGSIQNLSFSALLGAFYHF